MLSSRSMMGLAVITMIAAACSPGPVDLPPNVPPTVPPPAAVGRLVLAIDSREAFVHLKLRLHVAANDVDGKPTNSRLAVVTSSNPSVATVDHSELIPVQHPNALTTNEVSYFLSMVGEGVVVLRVTLGTVTDSVILNVRPLPPLALNILGVDSFRVLEYRVCPNGACPHVMYAHLLKLREQTGSSSADVIAVEYSVPTLSTGFCTAGSGVVHYSAGLSAYVSYVDPYPYANDMVISSATPVPDGLARARVIVRDANKTYGMIEATAPIQRMVLNPDLPPPSFPDPGWGCNGRTS